MKLFETREPVRYYPKITIPAEAPPGPYRETFKKGRMRFVQAAGASQFVIEAPKGRSGGSPGVIPVPRLIWSRRSAIDTTAAGSYQAWISCSFASATGRIRRL